MRLAAGWPPWIDVQVHLPVVEHVAVGIEGSVHILVEEGMVASRASG